MITFEKEVEGEEGLIFIECEESEATHKKVTWPETKNGMGQEKPGRRFKL